METTLFLAKAFGIYMVVISLAMMLNPTHMRKIMITEMIEHPAALTMGALMPLILGIILVLFHNVWAMGFPIVITLLCWWVLIKGCLGLFVPNLMIKTGTVFEKNSALYTMGVIMFLIGVLFLYKGFF